MKKRIVPVFAAILLLCTLSVCSKGSAERKREKSITWNSLEELVSLMTLDEKIGQMTQAERRDLLKGDITEYTLGSILSGGGSTPNINTPEGWVSMLNGFAEESLATRLGIPVLYGLDAVHGHNNALDAVILPHNVGLGAIAAGDPARGAEAAYTAGRITAAEMLATGVRWTFAPVLGVAEDIRWGRTYESYSENVDTVTIMGSNLIRGLQDNGAFACMKHFLGEGQTIDGRNQGNAVLDRAGIERILPPYEAAINAGAMSLMPSFSSVNNVKMHEKKDLLTDLLKDEMGFKGFIVSDWAAIHQLSGSSYKEKIANAINAGVDMYMATNGRGNWIDFIKHLKELVNDGTVPMERIDDAVLRILRFKQYIELFNGLFNEPLTKKAGVIGTDEHRAAARSLAADSLVLLRNENDIIAQLPGFKNILVAGQGAHDIGMQCGGWTISWQGRHGPITKGTTILEGIQTATAGKAVISYAEDGIADGDFDVIIAVIGEDPYAETQGDRSQPFIPLDPDQNHIKNIDTMNEQFNQINIRKEDSDVLWEAYGYDCPIIVIMLSGRPMTIGDEYLNWDAFIAAWLPGTEGNAIADVLFGDRDFTGKTPYTWRKTIGGEVLYPFGFGLGKCD